jgi:putative hydrolase of the HAD superfamily
MDCRLKTPPYFMIKTIIFDLGNVIVSFDHRKISKRLEAFCGQTSDVIFGKAVAGALVQEYNLGRISTGEFFAAVNRELDLRIGYEDFYAAWNCTFLPEPIISERLVKMLSEKYRLLILSDTNEMHFDFIRENFPILDYFDDFIVSHKVNVVKPSAEIFQKAVALADCLPPECLFIDDIAANVEGARKSGLNALQFISAPKLTADLIALNLLPENFS